MKKLLTATSFAALTVALIAASATAAVAAGYEPQGYFGGRGTPDGAINLRRSTTEAYTLARGQSVAERPRPDFAPTPIDVGSFQLFPSLYAGAYYDTNIYASSANEQDDLVWKVDPVANLISNWGRHAVAMTALGDFNYYADNSDEDTINGAFQAEGRYDIAARTYLAANAGYQRTSEPRSNANVVGGLAEPVRFDVMTAGVEAFRGAGLLSAKLGFDTKAYEYDNAAVTGGGVSTQNLRDRTQNTISTEIAYDVSGNFKPFVRGEFDWRDYGRNTQRSSEGYGINAGAKMDFGGLVTGTAYAGYLTRDYRNFANGTVDVLDLGADLLWNVTNITSIAAEFGRSVEETTVGGFVAPGAASSYTATGGSITATHELMRDLIIEARSDYTQNEFNLSPREDNIWGVGVGARYYITRNFFADTTYDFSQRDSNVAGVDYDKNVVFVRFGAQY